MDARDALPALHRAETRERRLARLHSREDLRELLLLDLPEVTEDRLDQLLRHEEIALGHRDAAQALVVGRLEEGILLHGELAHEIEPQPVAVGPEHVAVYGHRVRKHAHCGELLVEHHRIAGLPQDAEVRHADLEGVLELPRLAEPVDVRSDVGVDRLERLQVRKVDARQVAVDADHGHKPALDEPRVDALETVRNAQHLALLEADERLAHRGVRLGPRCDGLPSIHPGVDRRLVELEPDLLGGARHVEVRREEAVRAARRFGDPSPRRVQLREKFLRLRGSGAGRGKRGGDHRCGADSGAESCAKGTDGSPKTGERGRQTDWALVAWHGRHPRSSVRGGGRGGEATI